jgi:hypothetical protein
VGRALAESPTESAKIKNSLNAAFLKYPRGHFADEHTKMVRMIWYKAKTKP